MVIPVALFKQTSYDFASHFVGINQTEKRYDHIAANPPGKKLDNVSHVSWSKLRSTE